MANYIVPLCLVAISLTLLSVAFATSPLQDFCVADLNSPVQLNGHACLDPKDVESKHFVANGLHVPRSTENKFGVALTPVGVNELPGLNTLGISLARIDYAPWGIVPPHNHPRGSEILTVIEGSIEVGFVTSNPTNRFIRKILNAGDFFVFPIGLVHYQRNVGNVSALSFSGFNSENQGVNIVADVVFGSEPSIPSDVLAKAFQIDQNVVDYIQTIF